jgi:uncharacterized protein (DUF433 family)
LVSDDCLWAVSEKVGGLKQQIDDPAFPLVTYQRGAAGQQVAVLRATGLRVQTIATAARSWGLTPAQIAKEYGIDEAQVREALAFYQAHRHEIDANMAAEQALESTHGAASAASGRRGS